MQFAGHETFAIREGWLHKGLKMVIEEPERWLDEDVADHLGVGRNMAKSIRHWLAATGLAETSDKKVGKAQLLEPTSIGKVVWESDPYFTHEGTWWALHINLVNNTASAATWTWFFNSFNADRFDRALCVETLKRHLELSRRRLPSLRTLERDVACLLASYARTIPQLSEDPEEANDCPFIELGILSHFKTSGYYQINQGIKGIPPEILGYALALAFPSAREGSGATDITIHDAARQANGPGKVFALTSETLFEVALAAEAQSSNIEIAGLAGSRVIRLKKSQPVAWIQAYYDIAERDRNAA